MSFKTYWTFKGYRVKSYKKYTRIFPPIGKSLKIPYRFASPKEAMKFIQLMGGLV